MKIALIEASHWHTHLYFPAFNESTYRVVAVSDPIPQVSASVGKKFDANRFLEWGELIDAGGFDFAFVFGRHDEAAQVADKLLDLKIPFSVEKPGGLNAEQVRKLLDKSSRNGTYVSVPLILRNSEIGVDLLHDSAPDFSSVQMLSFRFIAGPLSRYPAANSNWMLDWAQAGGGCTINLAPHFIDLAIQLAGPITSVSAVMSESDIAPKIEVYSSLVLQHQFGAVSNIETGYLFPSSPKIQREFSFTMSSTKKYISSGEKKIIVWDKTTTSEQPLIIKSELDTDPLYEVFARQSLIEAERKKEPHVGLKDLHKVMTIIDAAYYSAANQGTQVAPENY